MLTFDLNNTTRARVNNKIIDEINKIFFVSSGLRGNWQYSLAFVGETRIRSLNRIFRGKDKVTDVLSFEEKNSDFIFPDDEQNLGEIIICLQRIRDQAKKYGWSFNRELARLLIHGLSHLIGLDHENVSEKKAKEMFDFEIVIMNRAEKRVNL
ncbi:MAG: rRNA maturation RNase YbeY [Candidatus Buchananbacteria bacterium]